jgi:hypothetical protein
MISSRVLALAAVMVASQAPVTGVAADILGAPTPTKLAAVKLPETREWVLSGDGVPLGVAVRTPKGMTLSLLDGREQLFDAFGTPTLAERAGSFVVFTPLRGQVATDWALEFYAANGKLESRNDSLHGYSRLAVAANGATVVVAGELKVAGGDRAVVAARPGLVIYDAKGKELARRLLPAGVLVSAVAVDADGQTIAVAYEDAAQKTGLRWQIQVFDRKAGVKAQIPLSDAVQGLRLAGDDPVLLVLVPGGVRVFSVDGKRVIDMVRLPVDHYLAGPGRLYWRGGQLLAVTEQPVPTRKGSNTWYLVNAESGAKEFRVLAKGAVVKSRGSPAFSMAPELGAKEWPVLVVPEQVIKINPSLRPKS